MMIRVRQDDVALFLAESEDVYDAVDSGMGEEAEGIQRPPRRAGRVQCFAKQSMRQTANGCRGGRLCHSLQLHTALRATTVQVSLAFYHLDSGPSK